MSRQVPHTFLASPAEARADSAARYNLTAILLHWSLAILIIGLLVLGWFLEDLPKGALRKNLFNLHKSFGFIVLALVLVRIYWRIRSVLPTAAPGSSWQQMLALVTHITVYGLMLFVPAIALLAGAYNRGFDFFIWHWSALFTIDKQLAHTLMDAHGIAAYALATLVLLHITAALWHHWVRKDGLLRRMWPR